MTMYLQGSDLWWVGAQFPASIRYSISSVLWTIIGMFMHKSDPRIIKKCKLAESKRDPRYHCLLSEYESRGVKWSLKDLELWDIQY